MIWLGSITRAIHVERIVPFYPFLLGQAMFERRRRLLEIGDISNLFYVTFIGSQKIPFAAFMFDNLTSIGFPCMTRLFQRTANHNSLRIPCH